jgi:hypothetical protein
MTLFQVACLLPNSSAAVNASTMAQVAFPLHSPRTLGYATGGLLHFSAVFRVVLIETAHSLR